MRLGKYVVPRWFKRREGVRAYRIRNNTKSYPTESWEINTEEKGVDIVSSTCNKTIEVKFDRMANDTWNLFIEVECNGKPSWINAYENMDVYAYGIKDKIFLFNTKKLRLDIDNNNYRKIKVEIDGE